MSKTRNTFCLYCNQHFLLTVGQDCMTLPLDSNKRTLQVWYGGAIMVGGRIQQKLRCMYGVHLLWHTFKRFIEQNIGWLRSSSKSVKKKKEIKSFFKEHASVLSIFGSTKLLNTCRRKRYTHWTSHSIDLSFVASNICRFVQLLLKLRSLKFKR